VQEIPSAVSGLSIAVAASVFGFAGVAHASPGLTVAHGNGIYGDPAAAAQFWRRQHYSNCAEMAVAD
jgi:hypothetical protein